MRLPKQIRTTISLPAASLSAAKARRVKQQQAKERARATFARYQRALAGFNEEELMILDGTSIGAELLGPASRYLERHPVHVSANGF